MDWRPAKVLGGGGGRGGGGGGRSKTFKCSRPLVET